MSHALDTLATYHIPPCLRPALAPPLRAPPPYIMQPPRCSFPFRRALPPAAFFFHSPTAVTGLV